MSAALKIVGSAGALTAGDWVARSACNLGLRVPAACAAALAEALPLPLGDPRYQGNALVAGGPPIEASFCEGDAAALRIDFEPFAPDAPPVQRDAAAAAFVRWSSEALAGDAAGLAATSGAAEALCGPSLGIPCRFGAFVGMTIGAGGLEQAKLYVEWHAGMPAGVPSAVAAAAGAALATIPGLVRLFASVATDGRHCAHRLYFLCTGDVSPVALLPALEAAGLGDRLPDAMLRLAPFAGGAATWPRGATVLSFREAGGRVECKVELLARALPVPAPLLASSARRTLDAQARLGHAFERWLAAIGATASDINVVGVRIAHGIPARFGAYASPRVDRGAG